MKTRNLPMFLVLALLAASAFGCAPAGYSMYDSWGAVRRDAKAKTALAGRRVRISSVSFSSHRTQAMKTKLESFVAATLLAKGARVVEADPDLRVKVSVTDMETMLEVTIGVWVKDDPDVAMILSGKSVLPNYSARANNISDAQYLGRALDVAVRDAMEPM